MTQDQLALLADARLSREARLMALHLSSKGDGEHEVPHEEFRALLGRGTRGMAKDDTIAGYVQELVSFGWLQRNPGGRGSPRYTLCPTTTGGQSLSPPPTGEQTQDVSPPPVGGQNGMPPSHGGAKLLVGSSREEVVGSREEAVARARARHDLDARVAEALSDDDGDLVGFRGALRDYLTARVPTASQWGYVNTIRTWLQGGTSTPRGLAGLDTDDQLNVIASGLNELLQDDELAFRSSRGREGSVYTLRTKIEFLVRRSKSRPPPADGDDTTARPDPRGEFPEPETFS